MTRRATLKNAMSHQRIRDVNRSRIQAEVAVIMETLEREGSSAALPLTVERLVRLIHADAAHAYVPYSGRTAPFEDEDEALTALDALRQIAERVPDQVNATVSSEVDRLVAIAIDWGAFDYLTKANAAKRSLERLLRMIPEHIGSEQLSRVAEMPDHYWPDSDTPGAGHGMGYETARDLANLELRRREGAGSIDPLIAALRSKDRSVRHVAASRLTGWDMSDVSTLTSVVAALADKDYFRGLHIDDQKEARNALEMTFGRVLARADVDVHLKAVRNTTGAARRRLVRALGRTGDARAVGPLLELLREAASGSDQGTFQDVCEALGEIGGAASSGLVSGLSDGDPTVRWAAVRLLGKVGDSTVVPVLRSMLDDPDEGVREAVAVAVERIAG
jgi:HEAT repeat protein